MSTSKISSVDLGGAMEKIPIVDLSDRLLATVPRDSVYRAFQAGTWPARYATRCVVGMGVNHRGEILMLRRRADKKVLPRAWDFAVNEQVQGVETYDEAFIRGLREELRLYSGATRFQRLGKFSVEPGLNVRWFTMLYHVAIDGTPSYDEEVFDEHYWFARDELLSQVTRNPGPPYFRSGARRIVSGFLARVQ